MRRSFISKLTRDAGGARCFTCRPFTIPTPRLLVSYLFRIDRPSVTRGHGGKSRSEWQRNDFSESYNFIAFMTSRMSEAGPMTLFFSESPSPALQDGVLPRSAKDAWMVLIRLRFRKMGFCRTRYRAFTAPTFSAMEASSRRIVGVMA